MACSIPAWPSFRSPSPWNRSRSACERCWTPQRSPKPEETSCGFGAPAVFLRESRRRASVGRRVRLGRRAVRYRSVIATGRAPPPAPSASTINVTIDFSQTLAYDGLAVSETIAPSLPVAPTRPSEIAVASTARISLALLWLFRVGMLMEFTGHGAAGISLKEGWVKYFAVY